MIPTLRSSSKGDPARLNSSRDRNVVLIGFMGSGKSSVARELATLLGREWVDVDEEIERRTGTSISCIFDEFGEQYFRDREEEEIERISQRRGIIIACGGGAVLRERNVENLKKSGVLIFLDSSLDEVRKRLQGDSSRPLLARFKGKELEDFFNERRRLYLDLCDHRVTTENKTPREIALEIREILKSPCDK